MKQVNITSAKVVRIANKSVVFDINNGELLTKFSMVTQTMCSSRVAQLDTRSKLARNFISILTSKKITEMKNDNYILVNGTIITRDEFLESYGQY